MVSNRLKADARVHMEQHPGTSYQQALRAVVTSSAPPAGDGAWSEIEEIIGQKVVKDQLRVLMKLGLYDVERRRRGLPDMPNNTKKHFVLTGAVGTGRSHVARVLASVLHAGGFVETGGMTVINRHDLVGTVAGESAGKVAAVFDAARGGVLVVEDADWMLGEVGWVDAFGREAMYALARLITGDRVGGGQDGPVVVMIGDQTSMRHFRERAGAITGLFELYIELATPAAKDLWELLGRQVRQPGGHGFVVDRDAEEPFLAFVENLKAQTSLGGSALDRLANLRFVRSTIECAYRERVQRLGGVACRLP